MPFNGRARWRKGRRPLWTSTPWLNGTLVATDVDSTSLTYRVVDSAAHGTLVVDPDGAFTYTPDEHFHGDDNFTFRASDGSLDSNLATGSTNQASET
jgi:VCBS repeat-containing protein